METEKLRSAPSWDRLHADMARIFAPNQQPESWDNDSESEPAARIWVVSAEGTYALSLDDYQHWR
ncbi:hypothetical protein E4T66_04445 [Sinimarinibacterium sp. CAU 1509]|uniref:hypothetical protein n=1 Tax=Sinimarinibacterium sp. CAU 1509 TaxID=2562283 RepID=UPI0010AD4B05|nr:hypothetical protein [Sinimarinibacterium sp. CAU 1509]TJY62968.1 hypothetical protein E4T66_04445 [Sinimarinibacterium sp. CAU 1509]